MSPLTGCYRVFAPRSQCPRVRRMTFQYLNAFLKIYDSSFRRAQVCIPSPQCATKATDHESKISSPDRVVLVPNVTRRMHLGANHMLLHVEARLEGLFNIIWR